MKKGKFIVLDGGEGSGKSTQMALLREKYTDALFTREPGGTDFAEQGPRYLMLKSPWAAELNGYEHLTQVFSGRSHHVRKVIAPALERGTNVFSDRFDSSSWALQIFGMENPQLMDLFFELRKSIEPKVTPDLYIILDISPEESIRRTTQRANLSGETNHFDEQKIDFHRRVRESHKEFKKRFPEQVKIIDASTSKEEVWKSIQDVLKPILG
jgi:dTMP kinase